VLFMNGKSITRMMVGLMFVCLVSPVLADELRSDDLNYAITLPKTWRVDFQNEAGFLIASPDQSQTITLLVNRAGPRSLDAKTIEEIERGLLQANSEKVSSRNFAIDGIPAYETIHRVGKAPFTSSFVNHLFIADGRLYSLQGICIGSDISHARGIQEGLASFRFLQPPKPPSSSGAGGFNPMWIVGILIVGLLFWMLRKRTA
jgi:hypothetical protein